MAEEKQKAEVAPHAVMSEQDASALQRQIILNAQDPDYKMPDGRTNQQVWEARAKRDEADRQEAADFERRSLEANTPRVAEVALRVEEGGHVVTSPVSEAPAATQVVSDAKPVAPAAAAAPREGAHGALDGVSAEPSPTGRH